MMKRFGSAGTICSAMILLGSGAYAAPADFNNVVDLGGGQYRVAVPGFGSVRLSYASTSGRNSYNGGSAAGFVTPHFALDALGQLTVSTQDFDLTSANFIVWDLDTVAQGTETVTFNGGSQLTGVNFNISNAVAHTDGNPITSGNIAAADGEIVVLAGAGGAAFAIGGIDVQGTAADSACIEGGSIVRIDEESALEDLLGGSTVCGTSLLSSDQFQEFHTSTGRIFELGNDAGEIGDWEVRADPLIADTFVVGYTYDGGAQFQYEYRLFEDGSNYTFCETGTGDGQTNGRANTSATILSGSAPCGF